MWLFFREFVLLPFQGPTSLNGYVVYEKYCNNGEKLSYSCLDPSNHSSMHISTDTKYINPWLKTVGWFLFWIQEENLNMKVLVLYSHFCSCRFFSSATLPSARIVEISPWKTQSLTVGKHGVKWTANRLLHLHFCIVSWLERLFYETCTMYNLHERPGYVWATKGTALSARTEHLWICAHLLLDPVGRAGEAELVMGGCWALHKVRVFEALRADGALQQRIIRNRFSLWGDSVTECRTNYFSTGEMRKGGKKEMLHRRGMKV